MRARFINERARFTEPDSDSLWQRLSGTFSGWVEDLTKQWFAYPPAPVKKAPTPAPTAPAEADPLQEVIDRIVEESRLEEEAKKAGQVAPPNAPVN